MYINGEWLKTDQVFEVNNPATGEKAGTVYFASEEETNLAIQAAEKAFPQWAGLTAEQRSSYLWRIVEKLGEKREGIAQIITKEMGKTIHHARQEVGSAIAFFQWYAEEARRIYGDIISPSIANKRIQVIRQPVGVVGAITPWNFPLSMAARKLGPALATGCTVILRPSREAPLSSVALFKIFDEIGLPKGVANLVIGQSGPIVNTIMNSSIVKKVSFTGSTEVGKILIAQSAKTVKRVSMELGGHAPFIVFDDADIDLAVEGLVKSKFGSNGQQCICPNRIYVQDKVYEEFAEKLKEKVQTIKVGNGLDEQNEMGPLVNAGAIEKVQEQVDDAVQLGACILNGGKRLSDGSYSNGNFYDPTVLSNVTDNMLITREETFGPVIPLLRFSSEEEIIERANAIEYGLASYFYTKDLSRKYRVSEQLEYGMVGVNDAIPFAVQAPFGGVKESGMGREGGKYGLDDYLDTKMISVQI
ncbi:NAD-dependent succinate-semialdehyde dehydrogenase [Peribacillus frigoritolerans]|uniref:NAD-dependent succinate-semialdehyde dehydrogenase n=1 Tax=Peribacillus frigoritolerans TaxID=450367 RepID=A0AAJ1QIC3_9BACI|nr:NAD-dependent succinate-semialdehyde dehydrogenase [Peribacillus frigoritolerans]MDM5281897.1 NAD-dependent succinate-semialdehyde dehydrogenase [Peribacillus frigoritolerans]